MENEKLVKHWIETADIDRRAMKHLFEKGDFHWSLFMGHLVVEKLLKALYIKVNKEQPPFIHNLSRLLERTKI